MKGCRPLSDEEMALVCKSFGGPYAARDKALFLLGVKSGFRISELLSLQVGDVWQHGQAVERVTVQRRHMKKKVEGRTVLLHPEAKAALTVWLDELKEDGACSPSAYMFQSRKGMNQPIDRRHAWRILGEAYAANGLTGKLGDAQLTKDFR
jgi:integrase